jgi:type I restriction enzyme M protein
MTKRSTALSRIIDRVDFNATTHGQRDLDDDRLSNLIEAISTKRLGLDDVEAEAREADAALREILRKIGI